MYDRTSQIRNRYLGLTLLHMQISTWESTSYFWTYQTCTALDTAVNPIASLSCSIKEKEG